MSQVRPALTCMRILAILPRKNDYIIIDILLGGGGAGSGAYYTHTTSSLEVTKLGNKNSIHIGYADQSLT